MRSPTTSHSFRTDFRYECQASYWWFYPIGWACQIVRYQKLQNTAWTFALSSSGISLQFLRLHAYRPPTDPWVIPPFFLSFSTVVFFFIHSFGCHLGLWELFLPVSSWDGFSAVMELITTWENGMEVLARGAWSVLAIKLSSSERLYQALCWYPIPPLYKSRTHLRKAQQVHLKYSRK